MTKEVLGERGVQRDAPEQPCDSPVPCRNRIRRRRRNNVLHLLRVSRCLRIGFLNSVSTTHSNPLRDKSGRWGLHPPRQDVMTNMKADWCVHQIALWSFHSLFSCITDEKEWSLEICSFGNNVVKFQRLRFCVVVVRVAKILELCFELDPLSCLIHFWNQSHKINTSIWVNPLVIASNLLICNIYVFSIPKEMLPSLNSRFLLSLKDSSLKHLLDFVEIKSSGRLL